ncbi:MAG: hypothetical protein JSW39_29060 [Desulfobacterales bacterium]|nr:MAG: hypothetical protein JSW39_29060 [Desulfobacterales bacterium]
MHRFDNYMELRLNQGSQPSETTTWPGFTNVVVIVLMIFMLAMIAVIIKNSDLLQNLRASERRAAQLETRLHKSEIAQADLKENLADIQEKLRAKEMEIILLTDETNMLRTTVDSKSKELDVLEKEANMLVEKAVGLEQVIKSKEEQALEAKAEAVKAAEIYEKKTAEISAALAKKITEISEASERKIAQISTEANQKVETVNRKVIDLLKQLAEKEAQIATLETDKKDLDLSLAKQRHAYSALEEKYIQSLRPPRSPAGRKVASLQYFRREGEYQVLFKDVDADQFERIDMLQLHARLSELKNQWKDKLYVNIIIPEDSGLSYNEAWSFSHEILAAYDYYYQRQE